MSDQQQVMEDSTILNVPHHPTDGLTLFSKILSYLFHPLLLSVYAFFFVNACYPFLFAHLTTFEKFQVFVNLLFNTIIFPVITVLLLWRLGFANSLQLHTQRERILPYIGMMVYYFWTFMEIRSLSLGDLFNHIMLGASISVFLAFFINNFFKISIHTVGAGNFVAIALVLTMISNYNLLPVLILVIVLAGLIGSSRLYLKEHTSRDIYTGYMVGIIAQLIAFRFL